MNIRKFTASSMKEALEKVKAELGKEAVILQTRTYKASRLFGLAGREMVEITATLDDPPPQRQRSPQIYTRLGRTEAAPPEPAYAGGPTPEPARPAAPAAMAASTASAVAVAERPEPVVEAVVAAPQAVAVDAPVKAPVAAPVKAPAAPAPTMTVADSGKLDQLEQEMVAIKTMVKNLLGKERNRTLADMPFPLMKRYHQLLEAGVEEATARALVVRLFRDLDAATCRDVDLVTEKLHESVCSLVRVAGPIKRNTDRPRTVALIGPTGVGKTTTIAKLAADFKLNQKLSVGLITIDTYRIAAVEQLKVYADIIGVPLNVVLSPKELTGAITAFGKKDIVLIDTAGRSQRDEAKMTSLRRFLDVAPPDEVHLVVSATAHPKNVQSIVESFSPVATDQMIITKMDEVEQPGSLLNVITKARKAISYVTTGQEVPDDIEIGRVESLAGTILGSLS